MICGVPSRAFFWFPGFLVGRVCILGVHEFELGTAV